MATTTPDDRLMAGETITAAGRSIRLIADDGDAAEIARVLPGTA